MNIRISIKRFNPETDAQPQWAEYEVPARERMTVLETLMYLYENTDPTLAFRFGCRFHKCGLCAVEVNGRPRMACFTEVRDGMRIGPLGRMPVLRDLVIDRAGFFRGLRELELFIPEQKELSEPALIRQAEAHAKLLLCLECLSCNATCPEDGFLGKSLAGPYAFVKLAQLHFDPRNRIDRQGQARDLGLDKCLKCRKCYCVNGIDIQRQAIGVLAGD